MFLHSLRYSCLLFFVLWIDFVSTGLELHRNSVQFVLSFQFSEESMHIELCCFHLVLVRITVWLDQTIVVLSPSCANWTVSPLYRINLLLVFLFVMVFVIVLVWLVVVGVFVFVTICWCLRLMVAGCGWTSSVWSPKVTQIFVWDSLQSHLGESPGSCLISSIGEDQLL